MAAPDKDEDHLKLPPVTVVSSYPEILGLKIRVRPYKLYDYGEDKAEDERYEEVYYDEVYYRSDQGYYCNVGWDPKGMHYAITFENGLNEKVGVRVYIDGREIGGFAIQAESGEKFFVQLV